MAWCAEFSEPIEHLQPAALVQPDGTASAQRNDDQAAIPIRNLARTAFGHFSNSV
jgi:hypothetical protein